MYEIESGEIVPLASASVRQSRKNIMQGSILDMRGVAETLERAYIQVTQKEEPTPDDLIVSFSSSGFICDSVTTQYLREDTESVMTMQEIDTMIKKIESESFARARKKCRQQFGIAHDDIRLVSSTITSIIVDEKSIANPIGFAGKHICLTVLNVFVPASEFNIIRSVVSSLNKQVISLIPVPLIFPKIIETSEYASESACIIDIGHTHITILLTEKNRVLSFETFPFGTEMLVDLVAQKYPDISLIQIENILCGDTRDISIEPEVQVFLSYVLDVIAGFFQEKNVVLSQKNLFCHGGFFENTTFFSQFSRAFEEANGKTIRKKRLSDIIKTWENPDKVITYGLALMAHELLLVKKDPLIRILRYVLYNYE